MTNITEKLVQFGLSHKEAQVYFVLLKIGPSSVQEIVSQTEINRSTAYVLLNSLVTHGLVSISESSGVKIFNPAPPERIIQYLEDSVKRYSDLVDSARNMMPELNAMYVGTGAKPKVQYYEGVDGIRIAYEATLYAQETIRAFASIENMHEALPDYFPDYYHRRAQKDIHIRAIFPDTPAARERIKHNKEEARDARLVPMNTYAFSPEINVYDNKIVFMSLVEKFSLIIESQELADSFKKVFELSWQEADRIHQGSWQESKTYAA